MHHKSVIVAPTMAHWRSHVNAVQSSSTLVDWLTNRSSLTARIAACGSFRVQRLHQGQAICLRDEFAQIGLPSAIKVIEREVILHCNDVPVVYAHTVLPLNSTASEWPLFASLGNRSLGSTLFSDPLVQRGALQYAKLKSSHPLMRRIAALKLEVMSNQELFARRSVFQRNGAKLLVTEVFLPSIANLSISR